MTQSKPQSRSNAKWFWIITLLALFIVSIAWFVDPLGDVEGTPKPEPVANPTEWTEEPTAPGVEVNLPQTPMKNSPVEASPNPGD
jgi:hypothetical protein